MTPAQQHYQLACLRLRIAAGKLLLQITEDGRNQDRLSDLLTFAAQLGSPTQADSIGAFRSAQIEELRAARADLDRLVDEVKNE